MTNKMMLFSGGSNHLLMEKLTQILGQVTGKAIVSRFSDQEVQVEISENVRGYDAFIIQSTNPPAENLMELVLLADALRRASVGRITAVIPYFGYARQDRRVRSSRVPISAKVVADMLSAVGIQRVLTVDLHADQIQGFFYMPVDNVYTTPVMLTDIQAKQLDNIMIISPDVGGVVRARAIAKCIPGADLAIIDKRRTRPNESQVFHVIGDVSNCHCVIIDDIVDTAGTLCQAISVLKQHGALSVRAYITHPVLSGNAIENINASELDELVVTDTIMLTDDVFKRCSRIRQMSMVDVLATAIQRVHNQQSLSSMFAVGQESED